METHPIDVHVGNRLRMVRSMLGYTMKDMATQLGVTHQQLQKYEKGVNRVSCSRLYDIANFLNIEVSFFFEEYSEDAMSDLTRMQGIELEPETISMLRNFNKIDSPAMKRKVARFIESLATLKEHEENY